MENRIGVMIVTESRFYGEALGECLSRDKRLNVSGVESDLETAAHHIKEFQPDIVLYDIRTPQGLLGVPALFKALSDVQIVALGLPDEERIVLAWAEVGIAGYVSSGASADNLKTAILATVRGELICSPRIAHAMCRKIHSAKENANCYMTPEKLTSREIQVLKRLEQGLSNDEISQELDICSSTVKNHVHNILDKLSVRSRGEAAAMVRRYPENIAQWSM